MRAQKLIAKILTVLLFGLLILSFAIWGIGDMFRVYYATQRDGLDFHLADIPVNFDKQPSEQFDAVYMRQLFDVGHNLAKSGYLWKRTPNDY